MTELNRLIHEPARLRLMSSLYVVDEADFVNVAARTGFTAGNLSSHISKLEAAGYVDVRKEFVDRRPRTVYRLTDAGRRAFEAYRAAVTEYLSVGDLEGNR
jgi:DNA-binding MarR family transcriptional regulator